ncbi:MAG TPA: hypothetical protein DEQ34_09200 [Balneolaceae bacterium]|nr:hypothetical protein [Balneolaceae bacterium]|tara:strand:+ start:130390 stop:133632 length:3243 start_codon:yes stop_codon:yes gene_type:complete
MIISLFLFLAFFISQYSDNDLTIEANYYIENIGRNVDLDENYWALTELFFSTCQVNDVVQDQILNSDIIELKKYYSDINCSEINNDLTKTKYNLYYQISYEKGLTGLFAYFIIKSPKNEDFTSKIGAFKKVWQHRIPSDFENLLVPILNGSSLSPQYYPETNTSLIIYGILSQRNSVALTDSLNNEHLPIFWINELQNDKSSDFSFDPKNSLKLNSLIISLFRDGQYQKLLEINDLTRFYNLSPDLNNRSSLFYALSYAYFSVGRYDESLNVMRNKLLPLGAYIEATTVVLNSKLLMGASLYQLGKFEESKKVYEDLVTNNSVSKINIELLNNLSISYLKLGQKNKYVSLMLEALNTATKENAYKNKLTILRNLFYYYLSISDYSTALRYLDEAESIALENSDNAELSAIHIIYATYYWDVENDLDKALDELDAIKNSTLLSDDYFDRLSFLKKRIEIFIDSENYSKAEHELLEFKKITSENSDNRNYFEALIGLAEVKLKTNHLDEAGEIFDELRLYSLDNIDFELSVLYNTLSQMYNFQTGSKREALDNLEPVIEQVLQRARTSIDTQTGFWTLEQEYIDLFNASIQMLISLGNEQRALQLLDELKTINDAALYNSPILRANSLSEEDLAQDKILNDKIQDLRTEYLNQKTSDGRLQIKSQIDRLSAQREEILNKVRNELPNPVIPVWVIQRNISNNELILHFTEVGDKLYLAKISSNKIDISVYDFDRLTKNRFQDFADHIASASTDLFELHEITSLFKLDEIPSQYNSITVIPDNHLYRIPLDILPLSEPETSRSFGQVNYLIEKYDTRYFTSLQEFLENNRDTFGQKSTVDFSAFAISDFRSFDSQTLPSLPYATREILNIDKKLTDIENRNLYLGADATKQTFLEEAGKSRILHVATHSEVSEQDPLFSTIYLNGRSGHKEQPLYAYELFTTQLHNEMVMLNSCSSGSGDYLQGSGVMGISRALRYAGAQSLALNLWSVNDKIASEFATTFYESLNRGKTKSQSMRDAKLMLLETGNANPHYWGAYMLIGNSIPITKKPVKTGLLYFSLLLIFLASGYYAYTKTYSITVRNSSI